MGHRPQLGEDQRERGDERNAKLEATVQSWQGVTWVIDTAMLASFPQFRNCFTQSGAREPHRRCRKSLWARLN